MGTDDELAAIRRGQNQQSSLSFQPVGTNKYESEEEEPNARFNITKASDQHYIIKKSSQQRRSANNAGNQSSRSYDSSNKSTKKEMIRFLSRILDRNKPLFVFNTRLGDEDESGYGTPSFSMITLIHENE